MVRIFFQLSIEAVTSELREREEIAVHSCTMAEAKINHAIEQL